MLQSFKVSNFRVFRDLKVERLGHVNLIVGRNNAGKSTFLEAVELYASNASPTILLDLVDTQSGLC
jgi:AAA15 family ATPase/GTPase